MIQIDGKTIEANAEQVTYIQEWKAEIAKEKEIKEQQAIANAQAKASAEAKLAALGLTAEDLKALGL